MSSTPGGTTIITGGNHVTVIQSSDTDLTPPLDTKPIPPAYVAVDAMHNAKQRCPQPKCHPGTRDAVMALLKAWIRDRSSSCLPICWLYGTAGVGKSAIMQDLCNDLLKPGGDVRASFFFGRAQGKRANGTLLFPTLAFQLAQNVSGCKAKMTRLLKSDPTIPNQTLPSQGALIVQSIEPSFLRFVLPASPITILIDGLDECDGEDTQAEVIATLVDLASKSKRPLRFLVASRPEDHILKAFNKPKVLGLVKRVPLNETFEPSKAIRLYLTEEFARIVREKHEFFPQGGPWPGDGVIELLVQSAEGQFIFADIIINFSSTRGTDPHRQLQIILDITQNFKAFSPLDALYMTTLSNVSDQDPLPATLACIIASKEPPSVATISGLTGQTRGAILAVVLQLRSILKLEDDFMGLDNEPIRIAHASFYDFLVDENRSGMYHVPNKGHTYLVSRFLSYYLPEPHTPPISHLQYLDLADDIPIHHDRHPIPCSYLLHALTRFFDTYTPYMPASQSPPSPKARSAYFDILLITLLHASRAHEQCIFDVDNPQDAQSICSGATLARRLISLGEWSTQWTSASSKPPGLLNTRVPSAAPIIVYLPVKEATSTKSVAFAAILHFLSSPRLPNSQPVEFTTDRTRATVRFDASSAEMPDDYHYSIAASTIAEALSPSDRYTLFDWWNFEQTASCADRRWENALRVRWMPFRGSWLFFPFDKFEDSSFLLLEEFKGLSSCAQDPTRRALIPCLQAPPEITAESSGFTVDQNLKVDLTSNATGDPDPNLPSHLLHYCARMFLITDKGSFDCDTVMLNVTVDSKLLGMMRLRADVLIRDAGARALFLHLFIYVSRQGRGPGWGERAAKPDPAVYHSNHRRVVFAKTYHVHI